MNADVKAPGPADAGTLFLTINASPSIAGGRSPQPLATFSIATNAISPTSPTDLPAPTHP